MSIFSVVSLLISPLVAWRITAMLYREDGPLELFRWLRLMLRAGEFHPTEPRPDILSSDELDYMLNRTKKYKYNLLREIVSCFFCLSIYVSLAIVVVWYVFLPTRSAEALAMATFLIPALSALSVLIDKYVYSDN